MNLAALADPDDCEEFRTRLNLSADRDAFALTSEVEPADDEDPVFTGPGIPPQPVKPPPAPLPEVHYDYREAGVTVRLLHPFRCEGEHVASVDIQPPRFDHVEAVLAGDMRRMAMFAEMAGISEAALGALRWPDAQRVIGICTDLAPE